MRLYKETFLEHNFLWTQWKKLKHFEFLGSSKKDPQGVDDNLIDSADEEDEDKTKEEETEEVPPAGQGNLSNKIKIYAKLENNFHLSNKYALFYNMRKYYAAYARDPFEVLPLTFHIKDGVNGQMYKEFQEYFKNIENKKKKAEKQEFRI